MLSEPKGKYIMHHGNQEFTSASNLFSAVTNGNFVSSATAAAIFTSNLNNSHGFVDSLYPHFIKLH